MVWRLAAQLQVSIAAKSMTTATLVAAAAAAIVAMIATAAVCTQSGSNDLMFQTNDGNDSKSHSDRFTNDR